MYFFISKFVRLSKLFFLIYSNEVEKPKTFKAEDKVLFRTVTLSSMERTFITDQSILI